MRRGITWAGGLVAGLWPLLAAAQGACPQGIAHDGVWLEFSDRSVLTRVLQDGRVAETEFAYEGGTIYSYITLPIGLVVESWGLVDGRVPAGEGETVTYTGTPAQVPAPVAGARFDGLETSRFSDGSEVRYTVNVVVGTAQPVSIGGCPYTGLPVNVTRIDTAGGPMMMDSMLHLAELGVTIYLGFSDSGQPPVPDMPSSISLTPPRAAGGTVPPPLPPAGGGAETK
ncbi:hypothetical protein [Roseicyclus persicicus]|uniref:Uncharacterized protein n=1 Tax=Roseicyclus persicicus TaxID=2650661 RepID=A0A7X6H2V8_9RHOB|nr:hypothetical protein [Roseibacterium persicicum]NKX45866.1 hypothetical protein [Roseibacterium persicicum]